MQICDFYLYIIQQLLPTELIEIRLSYDGNIELKIDDVIKVINDTFSAFDYMDYDDVKTVKSHLCSMAITEPNGKYKNVFLDDVIDAVMKTWLSIQTKEDASLLEIFKNGDDNGDGVLSLEEFTSMVKEIDTNTPERTIVRMFNQCGSENEQGEMIILPQRFVQVMKSQKYGSFMSSLSNT